MKPQCQQKESSYVFKYPEIAKFADMQNHAFWTWDEIDVEKDLHDMKTNFSESEYHGVVTTLKLFTLYELVAGSEYWGGRFKRMFPRPEFQRLASCFSHFELNTHAPFYNRINEVLGLNTNEFYTDYVNNPILKSRMDFIDNYVTSNNDLLSLAVFSIVEGAILYSSFAFLKHFQVEGKNKLVNISAGIDFSVNDELMHSEAGAYVFKLLRKELGNTDKKLDDEIYAACDIIAQHENKIIDMVFEKGSIEGITATQMTHFVESRLDECLVCLGLEKRYKPTYNPIAKWFYKSVKMNQLHDSFVKVGNEYKRGYVETKFTWK